MKKGSQLSHGSNPLSQLHGSQRAAFDRHVSESRIEHLDEVDEPIVLDLSALRRDVGARELIVVAQTRPDVHELARRGVLRVPADRRGRNDEVQGVGLRPRKSPRRWRDDVLLDHVVVRHVPGSVAEPVEPDVEIEVLTDEAATLRVFHRNGDRDPAVLSGDVGREEGHAVLEAVPVRDVPRAVAVVAPVLFGTELLAQPLVGGGLVLGERVGEIGVAIVGVDARPTRPGPGLDLGLSREGAVGVDAAVSHFERPTGRRVVTRAAHAVAGLLDSPADLGLGIAGELAHDESREPRDVRRRRRCAVKRHRVVAAVVAARALNVGGRDQNARSHDIEAGAVV